MPQASDELRAMFADDGEAWKVLEEDFCDLKGMLYPNVEGYVPTEKQNAAINYLCDEWDYAYDPAYGSSEEVKVEHTRKMKIVHAIWLCAHVIGKQDNDTTLIMEMAAKIVEVDPKHLFDGFNKDYLDRAWCSRPADWKPVDSLAGPVTSSGKVA